MTVVCCELFFFKGVAYLCAVWRRDSMCDAMLYIKERKGEKKYISVIRYSELATMATGYFHRV